MNQQKRILLFGRLGKNPQLKYTKKQEPVCTFSIAEQIEGQDSPIWYNIVIWGKQAEQCNLYLKKGSPIFVRGQKHIRDFTNNKGERRKFEELRADFVGFTYS